eukprot:CAMPEP_0172651822 /NCGR_PEP_ID=MMETSP1068-20121228/243006_1 /TAXON_ID=35684 /ORGANISM="Pseudopedinella elastica, Strain CCMP716" /LENGTH=337 /DNA_ID=CAMNT_0013466225 /DNA_START=41 /DNA_END=1054 /DNA_ORIENTATION=-
MSSKHETKKLKKLYDDQGPKKRQAALQKAWEQFQASKKAEDPGAQQQAKPTANESVVEKPNPADKKSIKDKMREKEKGKKAAAWIEATDKHAFTTVASDHAETPLESYRDLAPFLRAVATDLMTEGKLKRREELRIFDPFYCAGGAEKRLGSLGFNSVINRNADFYDEVRFPHPSHDILVTNPPFSGDHIERLVAHVAARPYLPFALLVPNFVIGRAWWRALSEARKPPPFYVVPHRRYCFSPPVWARRDAHDGGAPASAEAGTSPFPTFWLCWAPEGTVGDAAWANAKARVSVFWSLREVPSEHRDVTDPLKKRPNPRQRKKLKQQRALRAGHGAS